MGRALTPRSELPETPDFESPFPSISALCRARLFAPRLHPDDLAVFLTRKGRYGDIRARHWRLVAVLKVIARFEAHEDAAAWYRARGLEAPRNCMVEGNTPPGLWQTGGPKSYATLGDPSTEPEKVIRRWDLGYRQRAKDCGVFLVTTPLLLDLHDPTVITDDDLGLFGGRMPGTQNPPQIDPVIVDRLLDLARRRASDRAA